MRVVHGRPAFGASRVAGRRVIGRRAIGQRVMGTLGAVALAASLLSACGGARVEPPADAAANSSPTPEASSPSAEPGAGEPSTSVSGSGSGEPSAEPDDGRAERSKDSAADDAGDDRQPDGRDGTSQSGDKPAGTADRADPAEDEPAQPEFIEYGEVSARVGALQQRLQDLGYFVTSVDDAYGGETQQAVFALQKAGGLYRDGVVGDATQAAADDGLVPHAQTSTGKVLEIDVDRQLVLAVEDGQVRKIINASSGNGETYEALGTTYTAYTPRGSFAVYREENRMYSSSLELGDMWRPKFFTGGIALHGSASVPAFPASHGCVRVSNTAMNWIWDTWGAPSGTPVVVY